MKYTLFALSLLLFAFFACENSEKSTSEPLEERGFVLNGTTEDMADSTWLILEFEEEDLAKDSVMVMDSKFSFTGKVDSLFLPAYLMQQGTRNYKGFVLENSDMSIHLVAGDFQSAKLQGSATDLISQKLDEKNAKLEARLDSLYEFGDESDETWKKIEAIADQMEESTKEFMAQNINEPYVAYMLSLYSRGYAPNDVAELYEKMPLANKNSGYGQEIKRVIDLTADIEVGGQYADFTSKSLEERKTETLSQHLGELTLVDFWASWCGPCRKENPSVVKAYDKFKEKGLEIVGVSLDDDGDNWKKAVEKDGLPWVQLSELNGWDETAAVIYGVNGIPDNLLIDAEGKILARGLRGEGLLDKIAEVLK